MESTTLNSDSITLNVTYTYIYSSTIIYLAYSGILSC